MQRWSNLLPNIRQKSTHFEPVHLFFLLLVLNWTRFGANRENTLEDLDQTKPGAAELSAILRRDIKSGRLADKERLPSERKLSDRFGIARGTVREALNALVNEGLVASRAGSGTYVSYDPDAVGNPAIQNARPLELIDARFALEPHICRLAVLHARLQDLEKAERLLEQMEQKPFNPASFSEADSAFHILLAEITGNSLLIWIMKQISFVRNQDQWAQMRQITLHDDVIDLYNTQHRQILNAIRSREADLAARLIKDHLETARLSLTRALET